MCFCHGGPNCCMKNHRWVRFGPTPEEWLYKLSHGPHAPLEKIDLRPWAQTLPPTADLDGVHAP